MAIDKLWNLNPWSENGVCGAHPDWTLMRNVQSLKSFTRRGARRCRWGRFALYKIASEKKIIMPRLTRFSIYHALYLIRWKCKWIMKIVLIKIRNNPSGIKMATWYFAVGSPILMSKWIVFLLAIISWDGKVSIVYEEILLISGCPRLTWLHQESSGSRRNMIKNPEGKSSI